MDHPEHDRRARWLHAEVLAWLREHPEGIARARATLARWGERRRDDGTAARWRALLEVGDLDTIAAAALAEGPEGDQLRQGSPLLGLLPPRRRWALLRGWRDGAAASGRSAVEQSS